MGYAAGAAHLEVECFVYPDGSGVPSFTGRVKGI